MSRIICVTPTIREQQWKSFRSSWAALFEKHQVQLITVWDGDEPKIEIDGAPWVGGRGAILLANEVVRGEPFEWGDLFCRRTDAIRDVGFVAAAVMGADYVLTVDDDVRPLTMDDQIETNILWGYGTDDPIQDHLNALSKRVPISWMNTAHHDSEYLRGVPYGVRDEAPVMLSHGVWVGVPDFDGETQLRLERCDVCRDLPLAGELMPCPKCNGTGKNPAGVPKTLPYYVGPVPRGVFMPVCAMNVMIRREMLPYYYLAPMGADSGYPDLHRFGDIWGGVFALKAMWERGWAAYSGAAVVLHQRASDATKNEQQERLGRKWNERINELASTLEVGKPIDGDCYEYFKRYAAKRERFAAIIRSIQEKS